LHHSHHLSRHELGALLIAGEIEAVQRHAFLPDVAELTPYPQPHGEASHSRHHLGYGRRARKDLHVDERVGREAARHLGRKCGRQDDHRERSEDESHEATS
jgi:hypothetical protein